MKKAIALISGGLDSLLAARLIQQQGIHVEGINFYTGFCVEGHTNAIRNRDRSRVKRNNALWVAEQLGIKLHIIDIVRDQPETRLWSEPESLPGLQDLHGAQGLRMDPGARFRFHHYRRSGRSATEIAAQARDAGDRA
jgi:nucleotide-binding universal stress UspA family protein